MKIRNWDKLNNHKFEVCSTTLRINTLTTNENYKIVVYDNQSHKVVFTITLNSKSLDEFYLDCQFESGPFVDITAHNFNAVIKGSDIQTMNSFIMTITELITKNSVLKAYFWLLGEAQKLQSSKNRLKQSNPSGTHGFPANTNPIIVN